VKRTEIQGWIELWKKVRSAERRPPDPARRISKPGDQNEPTGCKRKGTHMIQVGYRGPGQREKKGEQTEGGSRLPLLKNKKNEMRRETTDPRQASGRATAKRGASIQKKPKKGPKKRESNRPWEKASSQKAPFSGRGGNAGGGSLTGGRLSAAEEKSQKRGGGPSLRGRKSSPTNKEGPNRRPTCLKDPTWRRRRLRRK